MSSLLRPRSWSLALKLPLLIIALVVGTALVIGVVVVAEDRQRFQAALEEKALLLARAVSASAPAAIMHHDYWSLYQSLRQMAARVGGSAQDTRILSGMVLDTEGRVLAHLEPKEHPVGLPLRPRTTAEVNLLRAAMMARTPSVLNGADGDHGFVEGVVPVYADGELLGVVRLRLSAAELSAQTWTAALTVLALTLAFVVVGSLIGILASARMVRPLRALAAGMQSLGRGEFSSVAPLAPTDRDEIGRLVAAFNQMAAELAEKRRLEQELARQEKLASLGQIAAGVAHEVNNPLGGMLNCIATLKLRPDDRELLRRYLPLIEKGLHRIRATVQSLLVDLREADGPSRCGLACFADVRDLLAAEARERNVTLDWQSRVDGRTELRCSCPQVQQMLLNLAKNGIEAMPRGGRLAVRSFRDGDALVLEVEDEGVGIPAEARQHLFEPFQSGRAGGSGLGLWLTQRIAESMGGAIEVRSEPGQGSLFRVRLPVGGPPAIASPTDAAA